VARELCRVRNITPDKESGIGNWSDAELVTAMTTGKRPDGRMLAPIMPWHALANLTKDDAERPSPAALQPPEGRSPLGRKYLSCHTIVLYFHTYQANKTVLGLPSEN